MTHRQCIYAAFGGEVIVTGEILHGKASPLRHDGKGVFAGLPQNLPVTRYHSLAGTHSSLPDCLEVTSFVAAGSDGGTDIIMGVRHKDLVIEGVQFHPESILTAEGRAMLKNFLRMQGGTWKENEQFQNISDGHVGLASTGNTVRGPTLREVHRTLPDAKPESILEKIYRHRRQAVETQKQIPSLRPADLQASYNLNLSPAQISFPDRLRVSPFSLSLMAEIKRASPSKGVISLDTCAPEQARKYAVAGASVISVLTEPEWFKGGIEDLRAVRRSLEGMPNRPAILRKEFIFDEYQILEARLAGADTVLLIVKMLEEDVLSRLYHYSCSLGMEPLVEVNTLEEMSIATKLGAKVIGVNNRNLTNFEVDLNTTSRLMEKITNDTIVCALSGISSSKDVAAYKEGGVGAVLVGEALMRATDINIFTNELLGDPSQTQTVSQGPPTVLVKICGTRSPEAAKDAIEAGADLIGIILVPNRRRSISNTTALKISHIVHSTPKPASKNPPAPSAHSSSTTIDAFEHSLRLLRQNHHRALLVGVFQNQSLDYILSQQRLLSIDLIQLHGSEPVEWASLLPVPVIRRFSPTDPGLGLRGYHFLPLLDSAAGGTGEKLDEQAIWRALDTDPGVRVILAGGLDAGNVKGILRALGNRVGVVDVSSGVEESGVQNVQKIKAFVKAVKAD